MFSYFMFELYVSVWVFTLDSGTQKSQKRASDPLKLELHAVVRRPTWVLGPEHRSSARTVCILN